jgi:hypothetical protein
MSTKSSFKNRVAHEPNPSELTGSFASFTSLIVVKLGEGKICYVRLFTGKLKLMNKFVN